MLLRKILKSGQPKTCYLFMLFVCVWQVAKAKMVIGDPSYFPGKVEKCGQVVRAICIMNHPVPDTGNASSVQIILPASQLNRSTGELG